MPDNAQPIDRKPLLVIITGASGTGKTTLATGLAATLDLPLLSRDNLKECLFDALGARDLAWSRRLGAASYPLLYHTLELLLATHTSCIVESNFEPRWAVPQLKPLYDRFGFEPLQIICTTHPAERLIRSLGRTISGARHPGHPDYRAFVRFPQLRPMLFALEKARQTLQPPTDLSANWSLALDGGCLSIDTTRLGAAELGQLAALVRRKLAKR